MLRPFFALTFSLRREAFEADAEHSLRRLYQTICAHRGLVQSIEPLRRDVPDFAGQLDIRIYCWHELSLKTAGADIAGARLISAASMGLAWLPPPPNSAPPAWSDAEPVERSYAPRPADPSPTGAGAVSAGRWRFGSNISTGEARLGMLGADSLRNIAEASRPKAGAV